MSIFAHAILHKDGRKKWGHRPPPMNAFLNVVLDRIEVGSRKFLCSKVSSFAYVYSTGSTPSLKINIAFGGTTKKST